MTDSPPFKIPPKHSGAWAHCMMLAGHVCEFDLSTPIPESGDWEEDLKSGHAYYRITREGVLEEWVDEFRFKYGGTGGNDFRSCNHIEIGALASIDPVFLLAMSGWRVLPRDEYPDAMQKALKGAD